MRFINCIGLTILLSSCATTTTNYYTQTVQSWRGGSVYTLVKQWGRPDRTITSPNGNTLYVYQTQSYRNLNAPSSPSVGVNVSQSGRAILSNPSYNNMTWNRGAMSLTCMAAFEVGKNGKILDTQIQGTSCYGGESFAKRLTNPASKP